MAPVKLPKRAPPGNAQFLVFPKLPLFFARLGGRFGYFLFFSGRGGSGESEAPGGGGSVFY